jgi:hypothetical protein
MKGSDMGTQTVLQTDVADDLLLSHARLRHAIASNTVARSQPGVSNAALAAKLRAKLVGHKTFRCPADPLAAAVLLRKMWNDEEFERFAGPTSIGAPIGSFDSSFDTYKAEEPPEPGAGKYYDLLNRNGRYSWQLMAKGDVRCTPILLAWWTQDAAHPLSSMIYSVR